MNTQTVGVVGYGRFGQFWADSLSRDYEIWVSDKEDLKQVAIGKGVKYGSLPEVCAKADNIFLCVPISQIDSVVSTIRHYIRPGTIVFDTCSVKLYSTSILQHYLGDLNEVDLIATHPMFGPDSGARGLQGLPIVMWPLSVSSDAYRNWHSYFEQIGLRVVELPPDEHDQLAANSQGVAHYIGRVLHEMGVESTPIDTTGFKILLSVIEQTCNDTWELFHDLQNYNPYTKEMRLRLESALNRVYRRLLPESVSPGELIVGIQGGRGSFNQEACHHYCSSHGITNYRIEFLYTSLSVLTALHRGEIDRGVFALHNSKGGTVMETIDALSQYNCDILDYFSIVISHCIMHHPKMDFQKIDTLISHPQALAQCESSLRNRFPNLRLISGKGELIDQALCAQHIAESKLPATTAVLAPKVCADLYNLKIHATDLQDMGRENLTTFVWAQRRHDL